MYSTWTVNELKKELKTRSASLRGTKADLIERFSTDQHRVQEWTAIVREQRSESDWIPSKSSRICINHFKDTHKYVSKTGKTFPKNNAVLFIEKNPGPSASKRKCDGSPEASINTESQVDDDSTGDDDHDITPRTHHHDFQITEAHDQNELALHEGCRCQVCHRDIIGFRYTCVQCADWDMCASCEARGEHPAHYVLRLPAPKPSAETEGVLAAIRKDIEDLLKLNKELHEYLIKEEDFDEVNVAMDTTEPMLEMYDRCVPEVEQAQQSTPDTAAAVPTTHTASHDARDEENEPNRILQTGVKLEMDTTQTSLEQAHHATSTVAAPASTHTAVPTTHTAYFSERDEDIEAVIILQTIKMEPTEDPLL